MSTERPCNPDTRTADLLVGLVAGATAITALLLIPSEVSRDAFRSFGNVRSPAFFPVLASMLLLLFSVALLVRAWRRRSAPHARPALPPARVAAVAASLLIAGLMIAWLGFGPTAFALILGLSFSFGARNPVTVLVLAVAVPTVIHVLFRSMLDVLLPTGVLF